MTFVGPLWPISPPLSLAISMGCVEGTRNRVRPHSGSPAASTGEGCRGGTPTWTAINKAEVGPQGWVPWADTKVGLCFQSTGDAEAGTSSHKHESVGQYLW